jgi:hypothetical protein
VGRGYFEAGYFEVGVLWGMIAIGWGTLVRCQSIVTGFTAPSDSLNFTPIQFSLSRRTCNVAEFLIFTDRSRK